MKILKNYLPLMLILLMGAFVFTSCDPEEEPTPTNELMEGVWQLTQITDDTGTNITDTIIGWFPCYFHLDDMNSVNSTAGPVFMYIVYGHNRFIDVTSKIDNVFRYADILLDGDITLTEGEWFIDKNKVVDNFTLEIKMRFPTAQTVDEVFELLNLNPPEFIADANDMVIYHKFKFISVAVDDDNPDQMIWEFTDAVVPTYNYKDQYGDYVSYTGISTDSFSRCKFVFEKRVKGIRDLTTEAANDGYGGDIPDETP